MSRSLDPCSSFAAYSYLRAGYHMVPESGRGQGRGLLEISPGLGDGSACVMLGTPGDGQPESVIDFSTATLCKCSSSPPMRSRWRRYADWRPPRRIGHARVRRTGDLSSIHLANNVADTVQVAAELKEDVSRQEVLRVLRPEGTATLGSEAYRETQGGLRGRWSHVYHGPDNNPSRPTRSPRYRTQFLAAPLFSPMPEVSVAAGGRIFKAFGHIAHKANQNAVLNTLMCINAYNGSVLWQRPLSPGFMIHRSTMIATPEQFYLADDTSCKMIDPASGQVRDEIVVPEGNG